MAIAFNLSTACSPARSLSFDPGCAIQSRNNAVLIFLNRYRDRLQTICEPGTSADTTAHALIENMLKNTRNHGLNGIVHASAIL
jgi:hypothetical protein